MVDIIIMSVAGGITFVGICFFLHHQFSHAHKLKQKLTLAKKSLTTSPSSLLKEEYEQIYNLYFKLSEKKKRHFYTSIIELRTAVEDQLKALKRLEIILEQFPQTPPASKKALLDEIDELSHQISIKDQEKYTPTILHLHQELEKETTS